MFITFYSYKGGVGRTMALANVAYLLATDKDEPCKVLVWDFDLEGPGLQHIFHCKWQGKGQGFVDLVYNYLASAELPDVTDYIYQTDVKGVEILPAGKINKTYSQKLDQINWRAIYAEARGYDFIQSIKEKIATKGYDYVLVDSRTGYSDVGGICTMQLPEVVVLLFRLNDQNIHGTKKVYEAIRAYQEKQGKEIRVVPVISPALPFGMKEANSQVKKARAALKKLRLEELSFEASLTFGEKIISKERAEYEIVPKICGDYSNLVSRLRELNPQDVVTMYSIARDKRRSGQYPEAFELFRSLAERRPEREKYWMDLCRTAMEAGLWKEPWGGAERKGAQRESGKELRQRLEEFMGKFIEKYPKNPFPHMTRATLARVDGKFDEALKEYTIAADLSPTLISSYMERAHVYSALHKYEQAIQDLDRVIDLDPGQGQAYKFRGTWYLLTKRLEEAEKDFTRAMDFSPSDISLYLLRSRSLLWQGSSEKALADIDRYLSARPNDFRAVLLKAHILGALDRKTEAVSLLDRMRQERSKDVWELMNLVEAYLAVGGHGAALNLLKETSGLAKEHEEKIIALFLRTCALALAGEKYNEPANKLRQLIGDRQKGAAQLGWEFETLRQFLNRALKDGRLTPEDSASVNELINLLERPLG